MSAPFEKAAVEARNGSRLLVPPAVDTSDSSSRLVRIAELAREFGSERVAEEATSLAERLTEGRFYVACIGQFKRGKSTLLSALVGYTVVPTGFIPVTAVPTVIRFGGELHARVRM